MQGGSFGSGARTAGLLALLTYGNYEMRQAMIKNSELASPICASESCLSNASGTSYGFFHDFFKLGGGRLDVGAICGENSKYCLATPEGIIYTRSYEQLLEAANPSMLGGVQGGPGQFLGMSYRPGDFLDNLVESFAGPHDYLNSFHYYDSLGNLGSNGTLWNIVNLAPAAPFAAAAFVPTDLYSTIAGVRH